MVSKVLYRPFEESDFDEIARIMQAQWHASEAAAGAYNFLEACDDLAYCLSLSTFSQVALVDDAPRGIVLARAGEADGAWVSRWQAASEDFMEQMHAIDPAALARYRSFIDATVRINDRLVEQSAVDTASEVTLLVVDKTARGLGIGSVLFDAARDHVAAEGLPYAYLATDTDCDWKFYEAHGMKRVARYRTTRDERKLLPREMYLYRMVA